MLIIMGTLKEVLEALTAALIILLAVAAMVDMENLLVIMMDLTAVFTSQLILEAAAANTTFMLGGQLLVRVVVPSNLTSITH